MQQTRSLDAKVEPVGHVAARASPTGRCQSDKIHLGDKSTLFQSTVRRVHCVLISLFDVSKINYRVSTASLTRPPSHPRWSISAFYILICLEMTFTNKLYEGGPEVFILFYLSKVRKRKFWNVFFLPWMKQCIH